MTVPIARNWLRERFLKTKNGGASITQRHALFRPAVELLEERCVPATHTWTGAAGDGLWSTAHNWEGDSQPTTAETSIVLNFTNTGASITTDDISGTLNIDQINFTGTGYSLEAAAGSSIGLTGISTPSISDTIGGNTIGSSFGIALTGTDTIQLSNGVDTIAGVISGTGQLVESGAGQLTLDGTNNYSGGTSVTGGTLQIGNDSAVGSGTLALGNGTTILASGANHTLSIPITLTGSVTAGGSKNLTINGNIGGTGSLTVAVFGILTLGGNNTYTGGTDIDAFTLGVTSNSALGTGLLTLSNNAVLETFSTPLTVNNPILLNGSNDIELANGTLTLSGLISGTGGLIAIPSALHPSANLILTNNNTYSGTTTANGANVAIMGNQPNSSIIVSPGGSGGSLLGSGTVGPVTVIVGGVLEAATLNTTSVRPPLTPAILTTGNLQFVSGEFGATVNGLIPGTGYGQVRVNGTISIAPGVVFSLGGSWKPHWGDKLDLIANLGASPISGFFASSPEGTIVTDPTFGRLLVTYKGGTGNDFAVAAVPFISIAGRYQQTGQWWVGQSNGSAFTNALFATWNSNVTWVDVVTGDFSGDGKSDIAGRDLQTGNWWVGTSNGTGFVTSLWGNWNPNVSWVDVKVGDFNGDGKSDIIGRYQQTGQWWLAQSTGSSFTNSLWATWNPNVTWADVQVADFNGDGKADITGRYLQGGQWWTGISNGSNFTTSMWAVWNPNVTWVDVNVGDFDGDGKSDITGRVLNAGTWWTAHSTGSSFMTSSWGMWNPSVTWVDVRVGDFNGDGKDDIIGRVLQSGQWWAGISTGSSFGNSLWSTWSTGVTWVDVQVGDFNGDGKADVTDRALESGQWWTGISNGSAFTTSLWATWSTAVSWVDVRSGDFA
jgi:autotransporter-associated beta strand protein